MKTMKNVLSAVLIAALIMPAMQGCKKGAEDPGISLKSRDSKVTGTWVLDKEDATSANGWVDNFLTAPAYTDSYQSTTTTSFDGTTETSTQVATDIDGLASTTIITTTTWVTDQTVELTLEKDGTVLLTTSATPRTTTMVTSPANTCPSPLGGAIPGLTCDGTFTEVGLSEIETTTGRWQWLDSKKNKTHLVIDGWGLPYVLRLTNKEMILEENYTDDDSEVSTGFSGTSNSSDYSKWTWAKKK